MTNITGTLIMKMFLSALLLAMFPLSAVRADEYEDYFQITCKPESDYFALRTLTLAVPDCKAYGKCEIKDLSDPDSRLFYANKFLDKPYKCRLQNRVLAIKLTNYRAAEGRGACGGIPHFDVNLSVDGKIVHEFNAYGYNRCEHAETHLIEFWSQLDRLRDCSLPDNSQASPTCFEKKSTLQNWPSRGLSKEQNNLP